MFEIINISKKYNNEYAIKNINIKIGSGLNFVVGASGSGKTTLLKIISGLDNDFDGEVLYLGQSLKNLNDNDRAYYYNNKFGFVWQEFNLIEEMTVFENIIISLHLKNLNSFNEVSKVLKKLKIIDLKNQKVKNLSGGQKQRVAIARELVKNPEVIIADEPTSALDAETSLEIMKILRDIAKDRMVIIVTHDTSLIENSNYIYEFDKGELVSKPIDINIKTKSKINKINKSSYFNLNKSLQVALISIKSKIVRSLITCVSIVISSVLLMTSMGGVITNSGNKEFESLFEQYGKSILDINVVKSFTSGSGGNDDGPKADVNQNIDGLYNKYLNDKRVSYLVFNKAFNNIKIEVDGKQYTINGSGTVPTINDIIVGEIPKNKGEVIVPQSFVIEMGISNEEALGKMIDFKASVYNWDSGKPILEDINIQAKIVGVADTNIKTNYAGQTFEFELEDSFFFDKDSLDEVNRQTNISSNVHDFTIRVNDPKFLIEIKNEISAKGIVPLGQFELVEDIVKLDSQTKELSSGVTIIISSLALIGLLSIALITSLMRKREYSIYKVSGYSKSNLSKFALAESLIYFFISLIMLIALSPFLDIFTKLFFGSSINNISTLAIGSIACLLLSGVIYIVSSLIAKVSNPLSILKSGAR